MFSSSSSPIHDVIIVGAGPVGLWLACELRLHDLSVRVLEEADDPRAPLKRLPFGMRGLSLPTLEALHRRGLLESVLAAQHAADAPRRIAASAHWRQQPRRSGGHFAGLPFHVDAIDTTRWPYRLPGPADTPLAVELQTLEAVLAAQAEARGAVIRRGVRVDAVQAGDDEVLVSAGEARVRGRWLVGCDGGRSVVRKQGGFAFVGTEPELTGYSIEVALDDADALPAGRHYTPTGMYTYAPPGTIAMVDFDGGAFQRHHEPTRAHVQAVLRRISGVAVTVTELKLASTWTDRAYQASTYRNGRLLLAGDAAHLHSPLGGQGLNLGFGDATNLGWKLAATLRGDAPAGLLDSYEAERHPIGQRVLDASRAQVALMRPTPSTRALAAIVGDLVDTHDGATYFAGRVWGVSQRYDLGGEHPLVGRGMPDFQAGDGTRLARWLHDGKGLLLMFQPDAALQALARGWVDRLHPVVAEAKDRLGLQALLVRPDGCVAWACNEPPDAVGMQALASALARWFGQPLAAGG